MKLLPLLEQNLSFERIFPYLKKNFVGKFIADKNDIAFHNHVIRTGGIAGGNKVEGMKCIIDNNGELQLLVIWITSIQHETGNYKINPELGSLEKAIQQFLTQYFSTSISFNYVHFVHNRHSLEIAVTEYRKSYGDENKIHVLK